MQGSRDGEDGREKGGGGVRHRRGQWHGQSRGSGYQAMKERWRHGVGAASTWCCPAPRTHWDISMLRLVPAQAQAAGPKPRRVPFAALRFSGHGAGLQDGELPSLHPYPMLPSRFGDVALLPETHQGGSMPCAACSDAAQGSWLHAPPCSSPAPYLCV